MNIKSLIAYIIIITFLSISAANSSENITFQGSLLVNPPCLINDGNIIEVNFDTIGINKISFDGVNKDLWRTVSMTINCEGIIPELLVRYEGDVSFFDSASVQTTISGLGIQLRNGDTQEPVNIGTAWRITNSKKGLIVIVTPVKDKNSELQSGSFAATANLKLEYS